MHESSPLPAPTPTFYGKREGDSSFHKWQGTQWADEMSDMNENGNMAGILSSEGETTRGTAEGDVRVIQSLIKFLK